MSNEKLGPVIAKTLSPSECAQLELTHHGRERGLKLIAIDRALRPVALAFLCWMLGRARGLLGDDGDVEVSVLAKAEEFCRGEIDGAELLNWVGEPEFPLHDDRPSAETKVVIVLTHLVCFCLMPNYHLPLNRCAELIASALAETRAAEQGDARGSLAIRLHAELVREQADQSTKLFELLDAAK